MPSDDFWSDLPVGSRPTKHAGSEEHEAARQESSDQKSAPSHPSAKKQVPAAATVSKKRSPFFLIIGICLLIVLGAGFGTGLLLYQGLSARAEEGSVPAVLFTIERGESSRAIAAKLEERGLLISRWPFLAYLKMTGLKLRAGVYGISASKTTKEIANQIADGDTNEVQVTIPEGWRIEEVAELLEKADIVKASDFLEAATYDPVRYTLPPGIELKPGDSLEGILFPDTYRFAYGATSKEIVQKMLENFVTRTESLAPTYAQIILASIIEREAKFDVDRPKIAGVYTNRLRIAMTLDADPTVQYAKDTIRAQAQDSAESFNWWQPITVADYRAVESVYNTYLHTGLPPTPIAAPGRTSIEAAVNPGEHTFFYFLSRSDGTTIYSKTLEEHNAAKADL